MDTKDDHYDPKSTKENPIWMQVDVTYVEKFKNPVSISLIKASPRLKDVLVAQTGSRLSIQPLLEKHFEEICRMGQ
jgi:predicted RNA-binding protein with PUA-like domain